MSLNNPLIKQTEDLLKKVKEQMKLGEQILKEDKGKLLKQRAHTVLNIKKKYTQNLVQLNDSGIEFVNINQNQKPKRAIFDDICSICSANIYENKYVCLICENCDLCEKCEETHDHPVVKFTFNQLSNLRDTYKYIKQNNKIIKNLLEASKEQEGISYFLTGFFNDKYELKLEAQNTAFTMRPNITIEVPLTIQNLSSKAIDMSKLNLMFLGKNTKDLKLSFKELNQKLDKSQQIDTSFTLTTGDYCKLYCFYVEIYCGLNIKFTCKKLAFKIEVNRDKEEEELNTLFEGDPNIITMSKSIKKNIKEIIYNRKIRTNPVLVANLLKNYGNNLNIVINVLKENNDKNVNLNLLNNKIK